MPRLQDLERFKRDLSALSKEAEVLERWGEKPEIIPPPDAEATGETAPKGSAPGVVAPVSPEAEAVPEAEEGLPPDFAALLDNLPSEPEQEATSVDEDLAALLAPADEGEAGAEIGGSPDFSTESFDFAESAEAAAEPEAEPQVSLEPELLPGEDAESSPLDFSLPELDESTESLATEGESNALEPETEVADFAIPDLDQIVEPEPSSGTGPVSEPSSFPEDFSVPDLGTTFEEAAPAEAAAPEEGLSLGPSELDADAFETFSFEEPSSGFGEGGFGGLSSESGAKGRDLDSEIASLSEEAPVADTFKIDQDWGGFGNIGGEGPGAPPPREAPPRARTAPARPSEEKFKPVSLAESQVDRLQDSLLSFPLNLRIAVEDILANERGSEAQQSRLVWALVDGLGAAEVAILAGRILKRHIPIPAGREKRTGAALEAEKGTLTYALVHTLLPVLRIGVLVLAVSAALVYLGWRYIAIPLTANSLYRTGYQRIAEDRFPEAEDDFAKATKMHEFIAWYYRYAEAYSAKRQYFYAENMYASLIVAHPKEKAGILAWARLEKDLLKFEEAVEVLKGAPRTAKADAARGMTGLLSWDYFNEAGLLLLGDIYLDWAEESPAKYEDARRTFAMLIEHYGEKDEYLGRMLTYFIRTDRLDEVLPLKTHFLADPKRQALNALQLAELGGYLLDKNMIDDVRDILLTAAKKDPTQPEAHYNLARYSQRMGDPVEERKALDNAVATFSELPGLGARRTGMYIDSLIWRGRLLAKENSWIDAERDYAAAAGEYEKALELRRVKVGPRFGEAYAGLADVAYWQRDDLASALALYDRAAANGYATADTSYKTGNILYRTGRYQDSLARFFQAGAQGASSPYLDYAFGSALYARDDLFSAEAYYRRSSAAMAKELADIPDPTPQEQPSQIEILRLYMKSENNLGVALYRSAGRSGDARRRNEAMAALTHSVKLYDQLSQEPQALEGPESQNLGLDNINSLLRNGKGDALSVYTSIEKDMRFPQQS